MNQSTKQKLKEWAESNNWSVSHPLDDERFWDFVIEAYKNGDKAISETEFYELVATYYQDEDTLTDFYIKYENGIKLLDRYNP